MSEHLGEKRQMINGGDGGAGGKELNGKANLNSAGVAKRSIGKISIGNGTISI